MSLNIARDSVLLKAVFGVQLPVLVHAVRFGASISPVPKLPGGHPNRDQLPNLLRILNPNIETDNTSTLLQLL